MTAFSFASRYYPIPALFTSGSSEIAEYLYKDTQERRDHLQESYSLGLKSKGLLDDLEDLAFECGNHGWDGYNAFPIQEMTLDYAEKFVLSLPLGIAKPTIGAEPDGSITFEWYSNPYNVFSISIGPDGFIHYAFLNGNIKRHGSEPIIDGISKDIVSLINYIDI